MGLAVVAVAGALWWLFTDSGLVLLQPELRQVQAEDISGSIGYVALTPQTSVPNYARILHSSKLVSPPVSSADLLDGMPTGPADVSSFEDGPVTDSITSSILVPAAPLASAAELSRTATFELVGPRIRLIHPDSPLRDVIAEGALITSISSSDPASGDPVTFPTPDSQRVLDIVQHLSVEESMTLTTDQGSATIPVPADRTLGVILEDHLVPQSLPAVDVPPDAHNPSAGLAAALVIYQRLTGEDLTGGRAVIAFGGISGAGEVLPLPHLELRSRVLTAADLVLVHPSQLEEVDTSDTQVVAVRTLAEAVATLRR